MATATAPPVPAGVTEQSAAPAGPAAAAAPATAPGPLARILTPVEPARPVKPLGTTATMGEVSEEASAKGGNGKNGKASPGDNNRGSAVAALVHALAARLARGGTAVKRTHTITEARVSGATSTGTNKAERTHRHDGKAHATRDSKLADLRNKTQQGRTNRDRKAATDAKTSDARTSKADTAARDNKDLKKADSSAAKTSNAKAATADTVSKNDDRDYRDTKTAKGPSPKGADAKTAGPASAKGGTAAKTPEPSTPAAARPDGPDLTKKADPKSLNTKTAAAIKPDDTAPVDLVKDTSAAAKPSPAATTEPAAAPKLRTRPAREAGYRDGTRVAATVGQARAYKDGAVDGWDDRTAADKAEGKKMSDTRARNAVKPKKSAAPKLPPASGSTVDLAKKPAPTAAEPARVTSVGDKAVEFVADGASHTMSRGEVRTLKAFERRLGDKKAAMGRVAEGSKATRLQAVEMATRAQRLAENAKSVHGGARIVALLSRLAERSQVLRLRAEEIEKSAQRGSEAVRVLAANAETRHGGIYRAVVDSPLTTPAEREFYMDKQGG
jgi:hypothetical protein